MRTARWEKIHSKFMELKVVPCRGMLEGEAELVIGQGIEEGVKR